MKWSQIKNGLSKVWNSVKHNPSKVYKDIKHWVGKHPEIKQAYEIAKIALESSLPEVIPIVEAVEAGGKEIDKFLSSEQFDKAVEMANRFI